tara:strand:+ start:581 stop:853 length:273 start_codon:yes stop_codon:yes gene_type:complete
MKSNQAALGLSENCSPRSFTAVTSRFGVCKEGGGEMPHLPLPLIDVEALAEVLDPIIAGNLLRTNKAAILCQQMDQAKVQYSILLRRASC